MKSTRPFVLFLLAGVCLWAPPVFSQTDGDGQPKREASEEASKSAKEWIAEAYKKSKEASSGRDYVEIARLLERALRGDALTPSQTTYARKLKGWAHNRIGESLVEVGQEKKALKQFEQAVELNPDHWKSRHNRGVSYAVSGHYDRALEDLDATLRLNPSYANAWFNRGEIHYKQGDMEAAIQDYTKAIRQRREDAGSYVARGNAYHQRRDFGKALTDYHRGIEVDPDHAESYVFRGDAYVALGSFDDAAEDYRHALRLNDQLGAAYRSIAWLMATCPEERFRDVDRAITAAKKAIALDGDQDYRYLETLAAAQANAGDFDEAQVSQKKAIELAGPSISGHRKTSLENVLDRYQNDRPFRQERTAQLPR